MSGHYAVTRHDDSVAARTKLAHLSVARVLGEVTTSWRLRLTAGNFFDACFFVWFGNRHFRTAVVYGGLPEGVNEKVAVVSVFLQISLLGLTARGILLASAADTSPNSHANCGRSPADTVAEV